MCRARRGEYSAKNLAKSAYVQMAENLDHRQLFTIDALALSSRWEIAAVVEVLERKGVLTRQKPLQMIQA